MLNQGLPVKLFYSIATAHIVMFDGISISEGLTWKKLFVVVLMFARFQKSSNDDQKKMRTNIAMISDSTPPNRDF